MLWCNRFRYAYFILKCGVASLRVNPLQQEVRDDINLRSKLGQDIVSCQAAAPFQIAKVREVENTALVGSSRASPGIFRFFQYLLQHRRHGIFSTQSGVSARLACVARSISDADVVFHLASARRVVPLAHAFRLGSRCCIDRLRRNVG